MDGRHVRQGFDALDRVPLVLGPAADGGYWLIGLRKPCACLFEDIPWSTPSVLGTTLERAKQLGLDHELLETLDDVDDLASWKRAGRR